MDDSIKYLPSYLSDDRERNARVQYEILMENIEKIEEEIDNEQEISLMLASFGQSIVMQVEGIGFHGKLLIFQGTVDGRDAVLMQHMSQMNILVLVLPKVDPNKPARRIGFTADDSC